MMEDNKQIFDALKSGLRNVLVEKYQEIGQEKTGDKHSSGRPAKKGPNKRTVEAIERTLDRIQSGQYTICEMCGETISEERLEAKPWTATCADCAISLKRQGATFL